MIDVGRDTELLREAIELARERMLAGAGGPFGAIVARDGWPISKGWTNLPRPNAWGCRVRPSGGFSGWPGVP